MALFRKRDLSENLCPVTPVLVHGEIDVPGKLFLFPHELRIPANVTGHSGDRDRFAHGHHAGVSFVL